MSFWGGKEDKGGSVADVDVYLNQIRDVNKQYRRLVDKLSSMSQKKRTAMRIEACEERTLLKNSFIAKKQAARANIATLKQGADVLKTKELTELQEEYRGVDAEFRTMGLMADKDALFDGVTAKKGDKFDPSRAKNSELLSKARSKQDENLGKLVEMTRVVAATQDQARQTAAQLQADREKMTDISSGLDDVQGELQLSRVYVTRIVKRLATDKVIMALTFVLVAGIIGIICYAVLNPGQKVFAVPCVDATGLDPNCGKSVSNSTTRLLRGLRRGLDVGLRNAG